MIHGYHVILPAYGFWLPNDPRGSWSDIVRKWELVRFGAPKKSLERRSVEQLSQAEIELRNAARAALKYPPVAFSGKQAAAIAKAFANRTTASKYTIWACAILPEHTHLVIARHSFEVEKIVNQLKGAATRELLYQNIHPLSLHAKDGRRVPRMWAEHEWKVYLDSEIAIDNAIHYVRQNPILENMPAQNWSFVRPFTGLDHCWITYH